MNENRNQLDQSYRAAPPKTVTVYHWNRIGAAIAIVLILLILGIWWLVQNMGAEEKVEHTGTLPGKELTNEPAQDESPRTAESDGSQQSQVQSDQDTFEVAESETTLTRQSGTGLLTQLETEAPNRPTDANSLSSDSEPPEASPVVDENVVSQTGAEQIAQQPIEQPSENGTESGTSDTESTSAPASEMTQTSDNSQNERSVNSQEEVVTSELQAATISAETGDLLSGSRKAPTVEIRSEKLMDVVLTNGLEDKEPVDTINVPVEMSSEGIIRLYLFTRMKNLRGTTVKHRWMLNNELVATVPIRVGYDPMRASSSKYIDNTMLGEWLVEIEDEEGRILAIVSFEVYPSSEN